MTSYAAPPAANCLSSGRDAGARPDAGPRPQPPQGGRMMISRRTELGEVWRILPCTALPCSQPGIVRQRVAERVRLHVVKYIPRYPVAGSNSNAGRSTKSMWQPRYKERVVALWKRF